MPAQSRTPQQSVPAKAPTTTSPAKVAGPGNAADQASMPASAEDAQGLLRDHTDGAGVSVGGELPGQALLGESDGNRVSTGGATGFSAGVERNGLWARFNPPLEIRPGSVWARMATGGITVSSLYYSFREGKASLTLDTGVAGDVLDVFMNLKGGIEGRFASAIKGALPAKIREPGYDPFNDKDIGTLLSGVVSAMGSAFPKDASSAGGDLASRITKPSITATVSPKPMEVDLGDNMKLKLGANASAQLTAHLKGTMGDALSQPKVASLVLSCDGVSIEHKEWGKIAGIDVRSVGFGPDLAVTSLDYGLGLESGIGALKALAMLFQLRTGQDIGVRDVNSPELKGIRDDIDAKAKAKLPELLKQQVLAHDKAIPGVDLSDMFQGLS